jgi:hypothetical protein
VTSNELILECVKLGLEGEKVDYEWEKKGSQTAVLKFEDGHKILITLKELK